MWLRQVFVNCRLPVYSQVSLPPHRELGKLLIEALKSSYLPFYSDVSMRMGSVVSVYQVFIQMQINLVKSNKMGRHSNDCPVCSFVFYRTNFHITVLKLNANFPGLLSALQPFSHPLKQLPLNIGLSCETYSRVSPGKLFLPFSSSTFRYRALGIPDMNKYRPIRVTNWVKRNKRGTIFLLRNPTVPAGFEPGTPRSRVLSLTTRPPSHSVMCLIDTGWSLLNCLV